MNINIYNNKLFDIGISLDLLKKENLNPNDTIYIHLDYSKQNNTIVFKLSKDAKKQYLKLKFPKGSYYAKFKGIVFLRQNDIDFKKYIGTHDAINETIDGKGECWVVYLKETS